MLDEFLIEIHPIGQEHVSKGAPVLVVSVGLHGDFFPKGEGRGRVFGVVAKGLAFLWAVNPAETDTLSMVAVQYFDGVAVENGDDLASEVYCKNIERR